MTTSPTTFLLARIAEDERRTVGYVDEDRSSSWHALGCGLNDDPGTWCECAVPARVLAECAAKRAIVALADEATGLDAQVDSDFRVRPRDEDLEPYVGDLIHRHLAAVYADHPDYDPAWAVS